MSYKEIFDVSIEEANYKLANDLLRDNIRLEKMITAAHQRIEDQGRRIAELDGTIEKIRDYLKQEIAKKAAQAK